MSTTPETARDLGFQEWGAMVEKLYGPDRPKRSTPEMEDRIALHALFDNVMKLRMQVDALKLAIDGRQEYLDEKPDEGSLRSWILVCSQKTAVNAVLMGCAVAGMVRLSDSHPWIGGGLFVVAVAYLTVRGLM